MAIFGSLYLSYIGDYALLFFSLSLSLFLLPLAHSLSLALTPSFSLLCSLAQRRQKGHDFLIDTSKVDLKATKDGAE